MRRIALTAAVFSLLIIAANLHTAGANTAQRTANKATVAAIINKPEVPTKVAPKVTTASAPIKPLQPVAPAPVMVTVQAGDTLSSIAAANNTTYDRLFDANQAITDPNVITPGQQLRVPTADEQLPNRDLPSAPVVTTAVASAKVDYSVQAAVALSGNDAKAFIYGHESGNNPNATSPSGCYGLGQDCNGVVRAQCGADYACQDAYFTNYALSRYGSWDAAASFWQANGWW